jgi:hypothetical protein
MTVDGEEKVGEVVGIFSSSRPPAHLRGEIPSPPRKAKKEADEALGFRKGYGMSVSISSKKR